MANGNTAPVIEVSATERTRLEAWSRRRKTAQAVALRARIILESAARKDNVEIARTLRVQRGTVGKWRTRFAQDAWTACWMSGARARCGRSPMSKSSAFWCRP